MNLKDRLVKGLLDVGKKHKILVYPTLALVAVITAISHAVYWGRGNGKKLVASVLVMVLLVTQSLFLTTSANFDSEEEYDPYSDPSVVAVIEDPDENPYADPQVEAVFESEEDYNQAVNTEAPAADYTEPDYDAEEDTDVAPEDTAGDETVADASDDGNTELNTDENTSDTDNINKEADEEFEVETKVTGATWDGKFYVKYYAVADGSAVLAYTETVQGVVNKDNAEKYDVTYTIAGKDTALTGGGTLLSCAAAQFGFSDNIGYFKFDGSTVYSDDKCTTAAVAPAAPLVLGDDDAHEVNLYYSVSRAKYDIVINDGLAGADGNDVDETGTAWGAKKIPWTETVDVDKKGELNPTINYTVKPFNDYAGTNIRYGYTFAGLAYGGTSYAVGNPVPIQASGVDVTKITLDSKWTAEPVVISYVPVPAGEGTKLGFDEDELAAVEDKTETREYVFNSDGTLLSHDDVKAAYSKNKAYYLSGWKLDASKSYPAGSSQKINTENKLTTNAQSTTPEANVSGVTLTGVWEYKGVQLYVDGVKTADPTKADVSATYGTDFSKKISATYRADDSEMDKMTFNLDTTSQNLLYDYGLNVTGGENKNELVVYGTPTKTTGPEGITLTAIAADGNVAPGTTPSCTITLTIGKKKVTIDDSTIYAPGTTSAPTKEYDGTKVIPVEPKATIVTAATGDDVYATFDSSGQMATPDAGEAKDITLTNVVLGGTTKSGADVEDCYEFAAGVLDGTSHKVTGKGRVSKKQINAVMELAAEEGNTDNIKFGQPDPVYTVKLTEDSKALLAEADQANYTANPSVFMTNTLKLAAQKDWTCNRKLYSPAGEYPITPKFGESNYNVTVTNSPLSFTVTRDDADNYNGSKLYEVSPVPDGHTFVPEIVITPKDPYTKILEVKKDLEPSDAKINATATELTLNKNTTNGTVTFVLVGPKDAVSTMVTVDKINIDTTKPVLKSFTVEKSKIYDPAIPYGAYAKTTVNIDVIYETKGSKVTEIYYYFRNETDPGTEPQIKLTNGKSIGSNQYEFNIPLALGSKGQLIVFAVDENGRQSDKSKLKLDKAIAEGGEYYEWAIENEGCIPGEITVTDADGETASTGKWYNSLTFSEETTDLNSGVYSIVWSVNGVEEKVEKPVASAAIQTADQPNQKILKYRFVKTISAANAEDYPAGGYTVGGTVRDNAGNATDLTAVGPYKFDPISPRITLNDGVDASEYKAEVEFNFTATEPADESGIAKVALYSGSVAEGNLLKVWNTAEDSYDYTITKNGTYIVVATDNAGNVSQESKTFNKISSLAPDAPKVEIRATSPDNIGNKSWFINEAPEAVITSQDKLSDGAKVTTYYTITYDDGARSVSDSFTGTTKTIPIDKQGNVKISAYAKSESDMISSTAEAEGNIDIEKPVIEITDSRVDASGNVTVSFKVSDMISGVDTGRVAVNGSEVLVTNIDGLVTGSFKASGNNTYTITAYDIAGNAAEEVTFRPLGLSATTVMDITSSSAFLEAYVTQGTNPISRSQCYVEYKEADGGSFETALTKKTDTADGLTMTQTWANLKSSTVYDYRIVAKTETGDETRVITGSFKTASKDATATVYGQARYDNNIPADYNKYPIYVNLYRGDTSIAGTKVTEDGSYDYIFKNVSDGTYRVVATDGQLSKEAVVIVENGGVSYPENYAMKGGVILVLSGYSTAVQIEDGEVEVAVDGLDKVFDDYSYPLLFDDSDTRTVEAGGSIRIVLHASYTRVSEVGTTEAAIFSDRLGEKAEVVRYITLYVTKQLYDKNGDLIKETEVPRLAEPVTVSFPLEDLSGQKIFVASIHGDANNYSFTNWGTADDVTISTNYVTITTDKFSLYALYRYLAKLAYTVNWYNGDLTLMKTEIVEEGDAATPPEETPTKAATEKYTYTFYGWDHDYSSITPDMINEGENTVNILSTFMAIKIPDPQKTQYTVNWYDGDNNLMKSETVEEDASATPPTKTPTKAATKNYKYTFTGWNVDYSKITADKVNGANNTVNIQPQFRATRIDPDDPTTDDTTDTEKPTTEKTTTETPTTEEPPTTEAPPTTESKTKPSDDPSDISKKPATYTYVGSDSSPKTGDATPIVLLISMMGLSGTGLAFLTAARKKKNSK